MTPKEKANELVEKFAIVKVYSYGKMFKNEAKQCSLICVDEIRQSLLIEEKLNNVTVIGLDANGSVKDIYWQEVKQEIEKFMSKQAEFLQKVMTDEEHELNLSWVNNGKKIDDPFIHHIMQSYADHFHSQEMERELIKYDQWLDKGVHTDINKSMVKNYLKQKLLNK